MENQRILDWLSARAESEKTKPEYLRGIAMFSDFCQRGGASFSSVVEDWRAARIQGPAAEQSFLDKWQDLIRGYATGIQTRYSARTGTRYAPLTQKLFLTILKSFFHFYRIPVDVDLPRRACVLYHNQDFTKEQLRMILSKATQRDRTIFLILAESGLRANTVVALKYWQISEDFEKGTVPMRILTPAETLKDHVGDRWSFIGEDGVKALREYLKPRLPLKAQDYVFASEKPSRVKGEQFTEASLSTIFRRITEHLRMERGSPFGKPGHYRMHGLRKYFRNNMRAEQSLREFWMGHSLGVDAHYVTRDPEVHRAEYRKGYAELRILEPATPTQLTEIAEQLKKKDQEIQELRAEIKHIRQYTDLLESLHFEGNRELTPKEKKLMLERIVKILWKEPAGLEKAEGNREKES